MLSTKKSIIISIASLFICFAMFVNTTYAWFTNQKISSDNTIESGFLNSGLYWAEGTTDPTSISWIDASQNAIFNNSELEPGRIESKYIKISNNGSLNVKYRIAVVPNGAVTDLADVIDVYFINNTILATEEMLTQDNYLGTLGDLINNPNGAANGFLLSLESKTFTVIIKMREALSIDYQGMSIGNSFSVQFHTTQWEAEHDKIEPTITKVNSVEDFRAAISMGESIILESNITLDGASTVITSDTTINLNGHSLSSDRVYNGSTNATTATLTVSGAQVTIIGNGTVENTATESSNNYAILVDNGGKLIIEDGTFIADESAVYVNNGEVVIYGGFFEAHQSTSPVPDYPRTWQGVTYVCYLAAVVNCSKGAYNNYKYGSSGAKANVDIYGGTFVNEDPSYLLEGDFIQESHVMDGYKVVREEQPNGDAWYIIVPDDTED